MREDTKIEKRLQNMKKFYQKTSELVDSIPDGISPKMKDSIKQAILGDKELKNLMDSIDSNRPPRLFLIGRTGVGKSSLINAICGAYVARVSDTSSCTETANAYKCKCEDRVLLEILDTRGFAESETINQDISAEKMLLKQINEFSPDATIFMLNCTHRDDIGADVDFLKEVADNYFRINQTRLPIIVVVNKADEVPPARIKEPDKYSQRKVDTIQGVVKYYKGIIDKRGLETDNIIAVSSLIDWQTEKGDELSVEQIEELSREEVEKLQIAFDGRYQIEELLDFLEDAIQDYEAKMGLRMAARLDEVVKRISKHLSKIFAGISSVIALTPIPISDIVILLPLQTTLVALIASLSGRDISMETAKEFIFSLGGVAGAGFGFRLLAQQLSKLINFILPTAGSLVSGGIAYSGTYAIGAAAKAYYIDGVTIEEAQKICKNAQKEVSGQRNDSEGNNETNSQESQA